jgi:hypothetical protein
MHTKFWPEYLKRSNYSEDVGVEGKVINIRTNLREVGWEGGDWKHLAQDRDKLLDLEERVTKYSGSINDGEFLD